MDPCRLLGPSRILSTYAGIHVQEAGLALLPLRPLLLHERSRPRLHLGDAFKCCFVRRLLLHIPWILGQRRHYMEK